MHIVETVIIEAVRTPIGKRNGGLATVHPADLLGGVMNAVVERSGIDPFQVGQILAGCVGQVGEQSFNIGRTCWLNAGLPKEVPATTVDTQCGSGQQAVTLATGLVSSGLINVAIGCGVESMSRIPIGSSTRGDFGRPINRNYRKHYEFKSQYEAAEAIARRWGVTRSDADKLGLLSQERAARAVAEGRFARQIAAVQAPVVGEDGKPTGDFVTVETDGAMRPTTLAGLAGLKPVVGDDGVHTAGTSSQIADGAAAVLLAERNEAERLGLRARATVVDTVLVGVDPELMLTGPIDATNLLLKRNGLSMSDIDVVEINEAFASVVLAWAQEMGTDLERVNPNGGAIAMGHPLGGTGAILVTKALGELERTGKEWALVTMCCGGGLGTGTLIRRS
jgi:acetyl-CoA C-acetyltransferase